MSSYSSPDQRDPPGRSTPKNRRAKSLPASAPFTGSAMVAEVATQVDLVGGLAAERAQPPDQAGRLGALGPAEGVRLVEHQELERGVVEQLDVLAAGEQQLELLDVGEQDARLPAGGSHRRSAGPLLGGIRVMPLPSLRICARARAW
jgi:hypothetical protein